MVDYHDIYLQWTVTIAYTYNERLPLHLLTMNSYHNICLEWTVTLHLFRMNGYHNIYLQWMATKLQSMLIITSTYNERFP
jgi:hypothetical protein